MLSQKKWCQACAMETMHHNHNCVKCEDKSARISRAVWNALTNEEKIEGLLKRVELLENRPLRY